MINIVPINELFSNDPYNTTILLVVFYIGIVIYLMSALICVYIDQYRLTLIEMGEPKPIKHGKEQFLAWILPLNLGQEYRKKLNNYKF